MERRSICEVTNTRRQVFRRLDALIGHGFAVSRSSTICSCIDACSTLSSSHTCRTWQSTATSYIGSLAWHTCLAWPLPILRPDLRTRHEEQRGVPGCERHYCMYDFPGGKFGLKYLNSLHRALASKWTRGCCWEIRYRKGTRQWRPEALTTWQNPWWSGRLYALNVTLYQLNRCLLRLSWVQGSDARRFGIQTWPLIRTRISQVSESTFKLSNILLSHFKISSIGLETGPSDKSIRWGTKVICIHS